MCDSKRLSCIALLLAATLAGAQQAAPTRAAQSGLTLEIEGARKSSDSVRSLLAVQLAKSPANEVLRTAATWRTDSTSAGFVVDALSSLLLRTEMPANDSEAETAVIYLASSLPVARIGPASFGITLRDRLFEVVAARPEVAKGVAALIDAYELRADGVPYRERAEAAWWHSAAGGRRAAWSSVLRALGDWYNHQGELPIARSFYETAIGDQAGNVSAEWVDRRALLPLAVIYTQSDPPKGDRLQNDVERYTEILFAGKGVAYSKGDVEQIRDFHTALGALYAARGEWTGPGARNAEFQLEHMRRASRELTRLTGRQVTDPPQLLEKLAVRYEQTGKATQAQSVKLQVKEDYVRRGRPAAGDSAVRRIEAARIGSARVTPPPRTAAVAGAQNPAVVPKQAVAIANRAVAAQSSIRGRVTDARTTRPLAGVSLMIIADGREQAVTTDSAGVFRAALQAGATSAMVRVKISGYAAVERKVSAGSQVEVALVPAALERK